MKVICINNNARPNEIPLNRWLEKDKEYTINKVCFMKQQNLYGVKLEEINNDDLFPYTYFALNRFGLIVEDIKELLKEEPELLEVL